MSDKGGFGSDLWAQAQKVRFNKDGSMSVPVKADGKDGIVVGDPPLTSAKEPEKRKGFVTRLLAGRRSR